MYVMYWFNYILYYPIGMLHVSPPFLCEYQTKYTFDGPILWCLHVQRVLFNIKLSNLHMKVCDECCNRTRRHYLVRDEYVYCDISIKRGLGVLVACHHIEIHVLTTG